MGPHHHGYSVPKPCPVARRHIVLLSSLHYIASTVMVLMVQILMNAQNCKWRGKSTRSGLQIRCHYQTQHAVNFSCSFVSVYKPSNSTYSSSQTTRPTSCSVHCQVSLTKLIRVQDKSQQVLKVISPAVQPQAKPKGAELSSSYALSSKDLPTSAS